MSRAAADLDTRLDEESLVAEARARAGCDDFGAPDFWQPMRVLLRAMEDEARLNAAGRAMQRERLIGLLASRARAQHWLLRHPQIRDERIEAPIVIVGLPRTGSTMLHRTIAAAPGMHSLKWWESRNPAPPIDWQPETAASVRDPRIAIAEAEVRMMLTANPELDAVHPFEASAPDEEIMLLEHAFMSGNPPAFMNVPSYFAWLESHDNAPAYRYMKQLLQLLQWQKRMRGEVADRWVLKAPHHLMHIDLLFELFPGATVIHTHRDVLETMPSYASMCAEIFAMGSDRVEGREVGEQWCRRWALAMRRYTAERDRLGESRFVDVWYEDAIVDPIAQVRRVYARVGMEFTGEAEEAMLRWADLNRREKRPKHVYTFEGYGFDLASLRRDFAGYRERFIASHL